MAHKYEECGGGATPHAVLIHDSIGLNSAFPSAVAENIGTLQGLVATHPTDGGQAACT